MLSARCVSYLQAQFHLQVPVSILYAFFPQNQFLWLTAFALQNLVSISGIFMKLMKVRDIKSGLVEWFSGRSNRTGKDFLCLSLGTSACTGEDFTPLRKKFWYICMTIPKYFSLKSLKQPFPSFCDFGCTEEVIFMHRSSGAVTIRHASCSSGMVPWQCKDLSQHSGWEQQGAGEALPCSI